MLSPSQQALAHQLTYEMLAAIFSKGLTEKWLPNLSTLAEMKGVLERYNQKDATGNDEEISFDQDLAASEHQDLFGFQVFPYQSIFLTPESVIGEESERIQKNYQDANFNPKTNDTSLDHISTELQFMAFLSWQESLALQEKHEEKVSTARLMQKDFLDEHLLRWLPSFTMAIKRTRNPFYTQLAMLCLELSCHLRERLNDFLNEKEGIVGCFQLPDPPDILEESKTGLREIASYLLTPVWSGFYISRTDIRQLSRAHSAPSGFGARQTMLKNLLSSAAEYDSASGTMDSFLEQLREWEEFYTEQQQKPALLELCSPWIKNLKRTKQLLSRIHKATTPPQ